MSNLPGRTFFSAHEDERLIALRAEGLSFPLIAKRLGRSIAGVQARYRALQEGRAKPDPEAVNIPVTPELVARLDASKAIGRYKFFRLAAVDGDIVYGVLAGRVTSLPPEIHGKLVGALAEVDRLLEQKRSAG